MPNIFRTKWQESPSQKVPLLLLSESDGNSRNQDTCSGTVAHQELGFQQSCKARVVLCHWSLWVRLGSRLPVNLSFYLGAPEVALTHG